MSRLNGVKKNGANGKSFEPRKDKAVPGMTCADGGLPLLGLANIELIDPAEKESWLEDWSQLRRVP